MEQSYQLSAEFLRVHSPSAEVRGHGSGQAVLVSGKIHVGMVTIKPVGRYGLQIVFDDRHDSGIYTWSYLYDLCCHQADFWTQYLSRLAAQHKHRDPHTRVIQLSP